MPNLFLTKSEIEYVYHNFMKQKDPKDKKENLIFKKICLKLMKLNLKKEIEK